MRIRSTKPEFWRSARIASVDWDARLVLKGLESYVDDNGVGRDDLALIVSDVFPRDLIRESVATSRESVASPRGIVARVSEAISALSDAGLVHRYVTEDTPVLYLSFWESVQRIDKPGKGRFRRPDGTMEYGDSEIRESVASPRESVAPGAVEQRNRGTEEQGSKTLPKTTAETDRFNEFWMAYPRKDDKTKAQAAYRTARKKTSQDELIDGARRYAADPNRDAGYTKLPATWLHAGSWANQPIAGRNGNTTAATNHRSTTDDRVSAALDVANRLRERENAQTRMELNR